MIFRSLLMTDLLPLSDGPDRRCGGCMLRAEFELVLRGSSGLGSAVELRVNMKAPGVCIGYCGRRNGTIRSWWNYVNLEVKCIA